MSENNNEKMNTSLKLRRVFVRGIARIIVFFIALHRCISKRITWQIQRKLTSVLSFGVVAVMVLTSVSVQGRQELIEEIETPAQNHNRIINYEDSVRIEVNQSQVENAQTTEKVAIADKIEETKKSIGLTEKSESKKSVVSTGGGKQNTVVSTPLTENGSKIANAVVENPVSLAKVEKMMENRGAEYREIECAYKYQFPVELGFPVESNYDGKQSTGDYVLNRVFDTEQSMKEDMESLEETEEKKETDDTSEEDSTEQTTGDETVAFRRDVWKKLLPTEPVIVEITSKEDEENDKVKDKTDENEKTETMDAGTKVESKVFETISTEQEQPKKVGTTTEESETTEAATEEESQMTEGTEEATEKELAKPKAKETTTETAKSSAREGELGNSEEEISEENTQIVNAGYYIVSGLMRENTQIYVGDITLRPTGIDGYNLIRLGEEGTFGDSVVITEDAEDREIILYFSNGDKVSSGVTFRYTKDTSAPYLTFSDENVTRLESAEYTVFCSNESDVLMDVKEQIEETPATDVGKYNYVYGDILKCTFDNVEENKISLPESFFGRVLAGCVDKAGNTSNLISQHYLIENYAPQVSFSNGELCTAPYTLWVDVVETGQIVSGIQSVECTINGTPHEIEDLRTTETFTLGTDLEVPSCMDFGLVLEEGEYMIEVTATDYAGNKTVQLLNFSVKKPELVSVFMPKEFTIHIDPQQLAGKEQIYSDDIELVNNSEFDVEVVITNVKVRVQSEVSPDGIEKDCDIYLITPDTQEQIELKKGDNEGVYTFIMPKDLMEKGMALKFIGNVTKNSDRLWKGSDISIDVQMSFSRRMSE